MNKIKNLLFYILNVVIFTLLSFIVGYNLKGYEIKKQEQVVATVTSEELRKTVGKYGEALRKIEISLARFESSQSNNDLSEIKRMVANLTLTFQDQANVNKISTDIVPKPIPFPEEKKISSGRESGTGVVEESPDLEIISEVVTQRTSNEKKDVSAGIAQISEKTEVSVDVENIKNTDTTSFLTKVPKKVLPAHGDKMVNVYHRVVKGECLSNFVLRKMIKEFVAYNPNVYNPNKIASGMIVFVRLPLSMVEQDSYMKDYTILKESDTSDNHRYILKRRVMATNAKYFKQSLMNHKISKHTVPYIDLSGYTSSLNGLNGQQDSNSESADDIFQHYGKNGNPEILIDSKHPGFDESDYMGFKNLEYLSFSENVLKIKEFIAHFIRNYPENRVEYNHIINFYDFFIFGETVVQLSCFNPDNFINKTGNIIYHIGVVASSKDSKKTIRVLTEKLSFPHRSDVDLAVISTDNMASFFYNSKNE